VGSATAQGESRDPDHVEAILTHRIAELDSAAGRLRAALLLGESPQSLGLVEEGLATVLEKRGISE